MATRTIALDLKNLEGGIEALSSAARTFQLTRFERWAYGALMVSVYVFALSFLAVGASLSIFVARDLDPKDLTPVENAFLFAPFVALLLAFIVGTVSLALNISLLRKLYRERARFKELGLSSLSKSLWKESRRSRWISKAPDALLIGVGILIIFGSLAGILTGIVLNQATTTAENIDDEWVLIGAALVYTIPVVLIFSYRYLRDQRERMELTASAEKLKKVLEGLRQHSGMADVVSVPSELLEQAAKIESVQIGKERNDAVLEGVAARRRGYAVTFDRGAAEERAALDVGDRVELEDLVAQLSIEGPAKLESQAGAVAGAEGATLRSTTKTKRVAIEYVVDQASHCIRITGVRHGGDVPHSSLNGASYA
jgi:hypothetical protein